MNKDNIDRRDFLKGAAAGMTFLLTTERIARASALQEGDEKPVGPPVKVAIIGLGLWSREFLPHLSRVPTIQVTALCDSYEPAVKRTQEAAPKATAFSDYRKVLESADVEAVIISTPTHLHKEIALAAIQAGKHVYCEAPIANSIEDAKAIALAGQQASSKLVFQSGLQGRSNPLFKHVHNFVKTGVLGSPATVISQWNKKMSWRASSSPDRDREANWKLDKKVSLGLAGEIGIHQLDQISRYLSGLPTAVTGYGSIVNWTDGRDVADTVQTIFEYPKNVRADFNATLASSASGRYTMFQGSNSSLIVKGENLAWLIKEADAELLGWEVYARKEEVGFETGIALVANATKLLEAGKEPSKEGNVDPTLEPLYVCYDQFARSIRQKDKVMAGPLEGYQATVVAIKANEAVVSNSKVAIPSSLYELK